MDKEIKGSVIILGDWLYLSPNVLINTDSFKLELDATILEEHKSGDIRFIDKIDLHSVSIVKT